MEYQLPLALVPKMNIAAFIPAGDREKVVESSNTQREMFMVADLAKSGLEYGDIAAKVCTNGYLIPYLTVTGEPLVDSQGRAMMYRVKLFTPGSKGQKYDQPSSNDIGEVSTHPYIPEQSFKYDSDIVYVCEGEKKAACVAKHLKRRAIGIGGCHSWGSKGEINQYILVLLRRWGVKTVVLVPDGDIRRYDINAAYGTFRQKLQIEGYDASIVNVHKGTKIDDHLWRQEDPCGWFDSLETFTDMVEKPYDIATEYGLSYKQRGSGDKVSYEVPPNESNLHRLLTRHPAFPAFWFDADRKYIMQDQEMLKEGQHDFDIVATFQHRFQLYNARLGVAATAVARAAFENERSPFLEWVKQQVWDREERLSTWLHDYCGAENTEYTRQLGRRWLIAAVARMSEPGCIVDYMLITKGRQGIGKSSLPVIFFGADNVVAIEGQEGQHKDLLSKMHLGLCANMEELSIMNSKEISALKPTITNRVDAFRRPFRRDTVQEPRRFVIYGSTDKAFPLPDDPAGHRRFPVVEIDRVDFARLEADRAQLWAEAACAYENGESYSNIDDVSAHVKKYVKIDLELQAFDDLVDDIKENKNHGYRGEFRDGEYVAITLQEICDAIGVPQMAGKTFVNHKIHEHMAAGGWENVGTGPSRNCGGSKPRRCWILKI